MWSSYMLDSFSVLNKPVFIMEVIRVLSVVVVEGIN